MFKISNSSYNLFCDFCNSVEKCRILEKKPSKSLRVKKYEYTNFWIGQNDKKEEEAPINTSKKNKPQTFYDAVLRYVEELNNKELDLKNNNRESTENSNLDKKESELSNTHSSNTLATNKADSEVDVQERPSLKSIFKDDSLRSIETVKRINEDIKNRTTLNQDVVRLENTDEREIPKVIEEDLQKYNSIILDQHNIDEFIESLQKTDVQTLNETSNKPEVETLKKTE